MTSCYTYLGISWSKFYFLKALLSGLFFIHNLKYICNLINFTKLLKKILSPIEILHRHLVRPDVGLKEAQQSIIGSINIRQEQMTASSYRFVWKQFIEGLPDIFEPT